MGWPGRAPTWWDWNSKKPKPRFAPPPICKSGFKSTLTSPSTRCAHNACVHPTPPQPTPPEPRLQSLLPPAARAASVNPERRRRGRTVTMGDLAPALAHTLAAPQQFGRA
jgi:hypothetical protein